MPVDDKNTIIELHIDITEAIIEQKINVLELLASHTDLSKQKLKDAMNKGAVWLSSSASAKNAKVIRRKKAKLQAGNQLSLHYNKSVLEQEVTEPKLVDDQADYSVWYKPYGLWSQGSKWGDHCSIGRLVEQYFDFGRQSYIVHRLDRAANGLMLIAHNKKAAHKLAEMFAKRKVQKVYHATVMGKLIDKQTINLDIDGKTAISHLAPLEYLNELDQSRVEVIIETGRKHQIRKHLAAIGHSIVGDRLYGGADDSCPDLQLTAKQLGFICPVSGEQRAYQA
ncbi:MAG: RluA family pseudouridine synthase [Kangiellaceae bacterium]|nr:RluA family pseudouridine synthase [Kangiellaceae bacterium]